MRERELGTKASIYQSAESFPPLPKTMFGWKLRDITMTRVDVVVDEHYEKDYEVFPIFWLLAFFTGIRIPRPGYEKRLEKALISAYKYAQKHAKDVSDLASAA
ncbi:hypothetical protein HYT33_03030 [Candidatus Roizmanbacteria bacterium]|nr:hypothetical protein [Candidatus Roizmanbacteria bacterium]